MALIDYVKVMPKVELNVSLHAAINPKTLATIADQNDITDHLKHFQNWLKLYSQPEVNKLDEIARLAASWVQQPDDLKLIVYELATALHHQNVRYAEISVDSTLFGGVTTSSEELLTILNDGRDRAERAWGIKLGWVMIVPREEPRKAEEIFRWASSMASRKAGIIGAGVSGKESVLPVGQFERPYKTIEKRDVARVIRAGDELGAQGVQAAFETLNPTRIVDARGACDSPELLAMLREAGVTVMINLSRALKHGWVKEIGAYPLRTLYDSGVRVVLGSDLATFYNTTLTREYQLALDAELLSVEELEDVALNAVHASMLDEELKAGMLESFREEYANLRALHV
jgi:aminodeoxyfutalosine deaminase